MKLTNQQKAYLYAILAIIAWSSISTAFKLSLKFLSPLGLLFFASLTATLFLGLANLPNIRTNTGKTSNLFTSFRANVCKSLLAGLLNPLFYYLLLFQAYSRLRAQEAQALNYTWAIVLALFSIWLLKERFRLADFAALLISFTGVLIISTKGRLSSLQFDDPWASFLALATSVIWALYWIINLKDSRPALQKLFYNFLVGFSFIACYLAVSQAKLFIPGTKQVFGILGGIYVGIFEMGLTFLLWFKALEFTENTAKISNLIFVTPFISLIFIAQILGERIDPATFAGLGLIVLSNLVQKGAFRFLKWNK